MKYIEVYLFNYLFIFIFMYIFTYLIPKKKDKLVLQKGYNYIVKTYKLKMDKDKIKKLSKILVFAHSFIISIPIYGTLIIKINIYLLMLLSLLLFGSLLILVYKIIGNILKKKGW